jgi:hypothetical protein
MTWAIESGRRAAEFAVLFLQLPQAAWSPELEEQWNVEYRRLVRWRQVRCRLIAQALRRPALLTCCMVAGQALPHMSRLIVNRVQGRLPRTEGTRASSGRFVRGAA